VAHAGAHELVDERPDVGARGAIRAAGHARPVSTTASLGS
jgi:hypothetical protein